MSARQGITLIGLPGSGKSSVGVQLAKVMARPFIDTDIALQTHLGMTLQDYLDTYGVDALREAEGECIGSLALDEHVVSTGGSAVYHTGAMVHLARQSRIVYLSVTYDTMLRRLGEFSTRGIAADLSQGLWPMYAERIALYQRFAQVTVDANRPLEAVVRAVLDA